MTRPIAIQFRLAIYSMAAIAGAWLGQAHGETTERPNFVFIITDDQSWQHAGCYGDTAVRTPSMDGLAEKGIRFINAYCASPSCSPSRAAILTGQDIFRLEKGGVLTGFIRDKFDVFPLLLENGGYSIGNTGKPYAPRTRDVPDTHEAPLGKRYNDRTASAPKGISRVDYAANFESFLDQTPQEAPFFFWVGISEPHLPHPSGLGTQQGISEHAIAIPDFYPNAADIRSGLSDYLAEIQWADKMIGRIIQTLEDRNLVDNTMIVFTSDNGMPFPRAKATLYDHGVRMPLIVRWDDQIQRGRVVTDPVSLTDWAPTFLELAELDVPAMMTGKSLKNVLLNSESGRVDHEREFVVSAFEKHTLARPHNLGFPRRALHSENWTYIRNYEPNRYPAGHPQTLIPGWGTYGDIDPSVIKTFFMERQEDPKVKLFFELGFGKVPAEELYDKRVDAGMTRNLAAASTHQDVLKDLRGKLNDYLTANGDPRMQGLSPWDNYNLDRPFPTAQPNDEF
ncbi:Arylsulfatase [Planctomycetes bacterium CA13]|uniref:Arylsulfatase n=1 Tax=Novipirellula herctigrandis TaxID=2527986 RepID=A0A5C5ZB28_9BACT|nr:Arylsulfatase [Planctomycetes bacterium CA13]